MNLLTKPCVKQSLFLWILQMGKGNHSSAMQQISFIIQDGWETPRSGTRALAARIRGSWKLRKCLVWHEGRKTHWCSAVNGDVNRVSSHPSKQSWSEWVRLVFSLTLYSDSTLVAATAQKSQFGLGHSLLLSSSCETGAKETELAATEQRRASLPSWNQCDRFKSPC